MTILGLGIDIIETARIKSIVANNDCFARRILSKNEWILWKTHYKQAHFLAKRFAVKEAAAKAFGIGIRNGLAFNQFEVFNNKFGKPYLRLLGKALTLAEKMGVTQLHVTLSDEKDYACAIVIIEG